MPIRIHGKEYVTVAERLAEIGKDLLSVETEVLFQSPVVIRATVHTKVGIFQGISAANPSKAIEKLSPYEVAETSAVGRALGFAGYGIVEGIATADEIYKAQSTDEEFEHTVTKTLSEPKGLTKYCQIHDIEMLGKISEKTGNEYWGHQIINEYGNRVMCFGK